jgi:hypothetical protein
MPTPATGERGQAAAEFAALLPLLVLLTAALWQVVLVGQATWSASAAARAAARAAAIGADVDAAARRSLPGSLDRRVRVRHVDDGVVEVRLRVPALVRAISLGSVTAHARFQEQT